MIEEIKVTAEPIKKREFLDISGSGVLFSDASFVAALASRLSAFLDMAIELELAMAKAEIDKICGSIPPAPPGVTIKGNIEKIEAEIDMEISLLRQARAKGDPEDRALGSAEVSIFFAVFVENFRTGGPMDFNSLDNKRTFENFGNFNFGAVGRALGLPTGLLLRGAGAYQIISGTSKSAFGNPFTGPPFGDDPKDQEQIRAGVLFFETGCAG